MIEQQPHPALQAAARLRLALEQTAEALASPRLEALLASETAIEEALGAFPRLDGLDAAGRARVGEEVDQARLALLRCRRLGSALGDFVRLSFEAQGRGGYGRPSIAYAGHALNERV
jgi:hypothetical protein